MYTPAGVKTSPELPVPEQMKAWVLGGPDELFLRDKPTPVPSRAEVLVRIDAVAICATDLEIIHVGSPARIRGALPLKKNFHPGTNIWARSQPSVLMSMNSRSASA